MAKSQLNKKQLDAIKKKYFDFYDKYLFQLTRDLTKNRLMTINIYVDECVKLIKEYRITQNQLKQFDLIYRVSID